MIHVASCSRKIFREKKIIKTKKNGDRKIETNIPGQD